MSIVSRIDKESRIAFKNMVVSLVLGLSCLAITNTIMARIGAEFAMSEITFQRIAMVTFYGIAALVLLAYSLVGRLIREKLDPKSATITPIREVRRSPVPQESIRLDEVIEIFPDEAWPVGFVIAAIVGMFILVILLGGAASWGWIPVWGALIGPIMFGLVLYFTYRERGVPLIRLDPNGLTSKPSDTSNRMVFTPWARIATCELVGRLDAESGKSMMHPVFYDSTGQSIGAIGTMTWATIDKQPMDRVLGYLKARFPKLDIDPWDL